MSLRDSKRFLPKIDLDPPQYYAQVTGEIALRWTRLEYQLGVLVRVITRLRKAEQRSMLDGQHAKSHCRLLKVLAVAMVHDRDPAAAEEVRQLAVDAEKGADRRDDFVHSMYGVWVHATSEPLRFRLRSAKNGIMSHEPASLDDLRTFAKHVCELQDQAQTLTERMKALFGSRR